MYPEIRMVVNITPLTRLPIPINNVIGVVHTQGQFMCQRAAVAAVTQAVDITCFVTRRQVSGVYIVRFAVNKSGKVVGVTVALLNIACQIIRELQVV